MFPTFLWALFFTPFSFIIFPRWWTSQGTYLSVVFCMYSFSHLFCKQDYLCKPDFRILAECSEAFGWLVSARWQTLVPLPSHPGKLYHGTRRCTIPREGGHLFARGPVCEANLSGPAPCFHLSSSCDMAPRPAPGACVNSIHIQGY